ncbi:hypothetical protein [Agrobacterium sp. lyk4-40-TYG-31]|uniref:hypothetical protein n=1 Tax=Agrobacterium sp. lyk4-40-TYG-31 TaxID=3040276 RepID=UPI000DD04071|nr:hypothetical protein [Agrobacterium sp. lyk4-40-TYG-31]
MSQANPHRRTIATLDKLNSVEWFRLVGVGDIEGVRLLTSWPEAISHASSLAWENTRLEAANAWRVKLLQKDKSAYATWNDRVNIVKPYAEALISDKLQAYINPQYLDAVTLEARWDILHLCLECEFADVLDPGFYHSLAYYYLSGHFPCGVEGDPASGSMVIY